MDPVVVEALRPHYRIPVAHEKVALARGRAEKRHLLRDDPAEDVEELLVGERPRIGDCQHDRAVSDPPGENPVIARRRHREGKLGEVAHDDPVPHARGRRGKPPPGPHREIDDDSARDRKDRNEKHVLAEYPGTIVSDDRHHIANVGRVAVLDRETDVVLVGEIPAAARDRPRSVSGLDGEPRAEGPRRAETDRLEALAARSGERPEGHRARRGAEYPPPHMHDPQVRVGEREAVDDKRPLPGRARARIQRAPEPERRDGQP